jgi:hypothetical protein
VKLESSKIFRRHEDSVDQFLDHKIDPQKEFMAGIKRNPPPYDSMDSLLLRFAKWWKGSSRGKFFQNTRKLLFTKSREGEADREA